MSTELKQAAQQALSALEKSQPHPSNPVIGLTNQDFIDHEETIRQLLAAIQRPDSGEPAGYMNEGHIHELAMRRLPYGYVYPEAGAGASTAVYTHPAPNVPEFSRIAKFKLDELQKQSFAITGYAIQRGTQRGFITNGGFVGWWCSDEAPSVPDDVVRDAAHSAVEELHKLNEYAIVYIDDPEWTRVSDTCQKLIGAIGAAMLHNH